MRTILLFCIVLTLGCSGLFSTDRTLTEKYQMTVDDKNVGVYYSLYQDRIDLAVKNISSSFMDNLRVSIDCVSDNGTATIFKSMSSLHVYNNKIIQLPFKSHECSSILLSYSFIPTDSYGFEEKREIPSEPIQGVIKLK